MSITTNDNGVLRKLGSITTNDNGVLKNIHSSNFVKFQEFGKSRLASGGLTNAQCIKGEKVTVSFTAKMPNHDKEMKNSYVIRIWFNNIKAGDKVEMTCAYTRDPSGYYIVSDHCDADGNVIHDEALTGRMIVTTDKLEVFNVSYTSPTDKNYINIVMGCGTETTMVFDVISLKINGKEFFGNYPKITFNSVSEDSSSGAWKTTSQGYLQIHVKCSRKVTSASAVSESFEWLSSSQRLYLIMETALGEYTFHPTGSPEGTSAKRPTGSASIVLIDNTEGTQKTLLSATDNSANNSTAGDIDPTLFTVGHSYSIALYANQTTVGATKYASAQITKFLIH